MIRDVAVKVPEPEDFIAEAVFPSHIVVPRCSGQSDSLDLAKCNVSCEGVCVSSAGWTCHPKKKPKIVTHDVVLYNINGSQVQFSTIIHVLREVWFSLHRSCEDYRL